MDRGVHLRRVSQVDREKLQGENVVKFLVTGVNGQLGHDVMNELYKRGHEGVGSDIAEAYAGVADGSPVTVPCPFYRTHYKQCEFVLAVGRFII